jgi:Putative transposase
VLQLLADPRHLGATPGLLMQLHSWGRNLSHHPHIHALVSAGGLTPDLRWRSTRPGYLLPLKPLQRLFSGKLLGALGELLRLDELRLPPRQPRPHWRALLHALYRKHWNIQINPAYDSGRSVTLYLARYVSGGPLPKQRALYVDHDRVSFDYTDHRDGAHKRLQLHADEFIARILWHAPPKGIHTVRHAGLYATAAVRHHRQASIALSQAAAQPQQPLYSIAPPATATYEQPRCPTCATPLRRWFADPDTARARAGNEKPFLSGRPRSTTAAPGPTLRSTGPPIAGRCRPSHLLSLRGQLLNAG